jgi:hypothetical protein
MGVQSESEPRINVRLSDFCDSVCLGFGTSSRDVLESTGYEELCLIFFCCWSLSWAALIANHLLPLAEISGISSNGITSR